MAQENREAWLEAELERVRQRCAALEKGDLFDGDYVLRDGAAWFAVNGFAIRIHATDEGVACDVYRDGQEMEPSIVSCSAFDADLEEEAA